MMTQKELENERASVRPFDIKGAGWHLLYEFIVQARLHTVAYVTHPKALMAKRILHYLRSLDKKILEGATDIFFGHTHAPFTGFEYERFRFHNTGSAIRKLKFLMLPFAVE